MSQPQNLRADELQHPTPVPTLEVVPRPATDDLAGQVNIATPRLRALTGGSAGHRVPATVRYAESMTDGALALRLQAITRLGVVAAPNTLSTLAAFTSAPPQARKPSEDKARLGGDAAVQAADAAEDPAAAMPGDAGTSDAVERKLTPVPTAEAIAGGPATWAVARGRGRRLAVVAADGAAAGAGAPVVGPGVPEVGAWASRLVQAVSEVLAGDRPISQLVRFTDEAVFTELNRRVRMLGLTTTATARGSKERSAVRSVRVCTPAPRVAEVAAHVRHGDRSRAIALRMEIRRNRWVCTALELG